MRVTTKINIPS